jgi:2-dehydro-3-deoxyphosphogluconate aldolase / (4S)-4-hydroxy-2-oxoglutarate aldolase
MILTQLRAQRVLPVLRLPTAAEATAAAAAMFELGLGLVELTATTPGWEQALKDAVTAAPPEGGVGLGTVADASIAARAIEAGARFLVSPWPVPEVRPLADAAGITFVEGAFTPAELAAGTARGPAKLFPAHVGGVTYLRSMLAVLPGAAIVPTGGIALPQVPDWLAAGAAAVGVGSDLLRPGAVEVLARILEGDE